MASDGHRGCCPAHMKVAIDTAGVQNVVEFAPIAMVADIVVEAVDTVEAADIVVDMAIGTVGGAVRAIDPLGEVIVWKNRVGLVQFGFGGYCRAHPHLY